MGDRTFLVLGGAGLVGYQVAFRILADLEPALVVVAARRRDRAEAAASRLREIAAPGVTVAPEWGDVFVRTAFAGTPRRALLDDPGSRAALCDDLLGPLDGAYRRSHLTALVARHRPDVVVDAVNTATGISYQDGTAAAERARGDVAELLAGRDLPAATVGGDVESLLLTLSLPQLIRHVALLHRALREAKTRLYVKVGTTGTGGMGLNIPYTHSEDRPSAPLLTKSAIGFAHTGLLLLMARTPGGPAVREVKPGALIGFADVAEQVVTEGGEPLATYRARAVPLGGELPTRLDPAGFRRGADLRMPVVDTGENGVFARAEFAVITAPGQMEFVTPEEIAALCVQEIAGVHTGRDVLAALESAVLGPSYRAGTLRSRVLDELAALERSAPLPSVALGKLGPPELGKLLWEAWLMQAAFSGPDRVLQAGPGQVAEGVAAVLSRRPELRDAIASVGLAVLAADGKTLWRGPRLRIPESVDGAACAVDAAARDRWAAKGWVDLRPANWERWVGRLRAMQAAEPAKAQRGSAVAETAAADRLDPGELVAWVLANELGGARMR